MQITRSETDYVSTALLTLDHAEEKDRLVYIHKFIDIIIIFFLLRSFYSLRSAEENVC